MSVVENFFEKFEKGELREAEREVTGSENTLDANGEIAITIDDLVDVESVVAVLVDDTDGGYQPIDPSGTTNNIVAAEGFSEVTDNGGTDNLDLGSLDDNEVGLQFHVDNTGVADAGGVAPPNFKVVARGY